MASDEMTSRLLLDAYRRGDPAGAEAIHDRYARRLIGLVRQRMAPALRQRVDPDDIVQSAYRSFFVRAVDDKYVLERAGDLWRLLAKIALTKLCKTAEFHAAQGRDYRREVAIDANVPLAESDQAPDEAAEIRELLDRALATLNPNARTAFLYRLQGWTIDDIASTIQRSHRTTRRMIDDARRAIEETLSLELANESTALRVAPAPRVAPVLEPGRRSRKRRANRLTLASRRCATPDQPVGGLPQAAVGPVPPTNDDPVLPMMDKVANEAARLDPSDYRLEKMLGAGGMGKVYRAWHKSGGRHVAVKALAKARHASTSAIRQFAQEAAILTSLRHPNLVESYGQGRFPSGGLFLVMEWIRGHDLQERIERAPLPLESAWRIVRAVADVLEFVHRRGIIHCDLKPSNVLIDEAGRVKVTDFGLAQLIGDASPDRGVMGGTPGFTAPEIWRGQRDKISPATDVYSLAAFFWALMTGKPPEHVSTLTRIETVSSIPHRLREAMMECLAESPGNRPQSVQQALRSMRSS